MTARSEIPDSSGPEPMVSTERAHALMKAATWAALLVAVFLFSLKAVAWLASGSVALFGSLIDSGLDILATGLNFVAVRRALQPPDREHRFGHGKVEALAGLAQGAFIGGSSIFLVFQSIDRALHPHTVGAIELGVSVAVLSIIATLGLVIFQSYVIRRTRSLAISADELHYRSDLLLNASVIVALLLSGPGIGLTWVDPLIGLVIGLYIGWSAWRIARRSFDQLVDREFDIAERQRIAEIVLAHPDAVTLHDLRTRRAGRDAFIQFHLELNPRMKLGDAHRISDEVEALVLKEFPEAEVIIHQDPAGIDEGHSELAQEDADLAPTPASASGS